MRLLIYHDYNHPACNSATKDSSNSYELAGELFFLTDRGSGFWNIYKWVISFLLILELLHLTFEVSFVLILFDISTF